MVLYGLVHLVTFGREAHGESLATFLFGTKKMPECRALSNSLFLSNDFTYPSQPVEGEGTFAYPYQPIKGKEAYIHTTRSGQES